jgi:hypothetical protein
MVENKKKILYIWYLCTFRHWLFKASELTIVPDLENSCCGKLQIRKLVLVIRSIFVYYNHQPVWCQNLSRDTIKSNLAGNKRELSIISVMPNIAKKSVLQIIFLPFELPFQIRGKEC